MLHLNLDGRGEEIGPVSPTFPENLLAAVLTARLMGIGPPTLARAIAEESS